MECEDIFAKDNSDLGKTDLLEHEIDTSNCKPMKQHPHWVPPYQQEVINSWKCFKLQARLSNLNILRAVQWYLLRNMTEHTVCALTTVKLTSWQRRMSYIPATLDRWRVRRLGWGSVFFLPPFGLQVLADANERRGWAYTVRLPSQLIRDIYDRHLISSVGRAPVCEQEVAGSNRGRTKKVLPT